VRAESPYSAVRSSGAYPLLPRCVQEGREMYYGYGIGGIVLLILLILILTGRL
jgi:hypothetical protein